MMVAILLVLLVISVLAILKGSDWITDSMVPVAHKLGTSYIAVTTLLVSLLISIPEIIISLYSFSVGHNSLGLGVIIGSVMINIGITVGLSAILKPLVVDKDIVVRDGLYLITIAIIIMIMGTDLSYSRPEGMILMLLFIPYFLNVWSFEKARPHDKRKEKLDKIKENLDLIGESFIKLKPSLLTFFIGAMLLVGGSYLFSYVLVGITGLIGVPEIIVGMVLGAIGTGTPNIAAAISGTLKGYKDAAITETFGSNIFTLLITLGLFIVVNPLTIPFKVLNFDLTWMIMIHILMILFIFKGYKYREHSVTRLEGSVLLIFYLSLIAINYLFF